MERNRLFLECLVVLVLLAAVAGCTSTAVDGSDADAADLVSPSPADQLSDGAVEGAPVDAPDGVVVYTGADDHGAPTGELVIALPDGTEVYRAEGRAAPAFAVQTGFPDRAWLLADSEDEGGGVDVGLLDATGFGVRSLDLPPQAWQVPRPGSARATGRYAALVAPGEAVALVDLGAGTATLLDVVAEPQVASLSPDGATLLVAGPAGAALVETADPTRVLPLMDARPIEWLSDGERLLVEGELGAGVLTLADGSIAAADLTDPRGAVPSSHGVVLTQADGELAVSDLSSGASSPLVEITGDTLIVDPAGVAVVADTADGLRWVPLDGGPSRPVGPSSLEVIAWPGPAGPRVAWFGQPEQRGAPLVGVDLATGDVTTTTPEEQGDEWATFDLAALDLTPDWRTGLVPLRNGQRADLLYVGLDRLPAVAATGTGVSGTLSPDGTLVAAARIVGDGRSLVGVGSPSGTVVVEVGNGLKPVWLPVDQTGHDETDP